MYPPLDPSCAAHLLGYSLLNRLIATPQRFAFVVIACSVMLRLVFAGKIELLPEETYYWNYSQHLDLGYLDHPPMVAWLIRFGTAVFGQNEFGVRVGAILCGAVTSFYVYKLTYKLFGAACGMYSLMLVQILPFFFLAGMLMTPDAPLTAAWAASLYYLERAVVSGESGSWWRAGLSLGLGLTSKYTIVLLGVVAVAWMVFDMQARSEWLRRGPYVAALLALLVFSPVIYWNAQHDWASFTFQTSRRLAESPHFAFHKLLAAALILITPVGVTALVLASKKRASASPGYRFLLWAVWIPCGIFALFSLRHEVKLDWTGAPFTASLPLLGCSAVGWLRRAWLCTVTMLLVFFGLGFVYLGVGIPGLRYSKHTELMPLGWRDLSRQIAAAAAAYNAKTGDNVQIVGMDRYAIASELAFYGQLETKAEFNTSSAHLFGGLGLMYERWTPAAAYQGRTLLLVAGDSSELSTSAVTQHAGLLDPIETDVLTRNGVVIRRFYHRIVHDYRSVANS